MTATCLLFATFSLGVLQPPAHAPIDAAKAMRSGRASVPVTAGFELEFAADDDDEPPSTPRRRAGVGRPTAARRAARLPAADIEDSMDMDAVVAGAVAVTGEEASAQREAPAWPSKMGSAPTAIQNSPSSSGRVLGTRTARLTDQPGLADGLFSGAKKTRHIMTRTAAAAAENAINKPVLARPPAPPAAAAASGAPTPALAGPPTANGAAAPAAAPPPTAASSIPSFARPRPPPPPLRLKPMKPSKIRKGDFVVHSAYGIGLFEGVFSGLMRSGDRLVQSRFLKVRFRDAAIEVPIELKAALRLFKRKEENDPLDPITLDSSRARRSWAKRKARALQDVMSVAADLLTMYAERVDLTRPRCAPDTPGYSEFESGFGFEPTPDQLTCFDDIRSDMVESDRPMDRLVCGDVGFGKTEAAMRAAFRAVDNGRQVAFLAPTTVLAAQHLVVLRKRMPAHVRVELLSSLSKRGKAEKQELLDDLAGGKVNILVGTHAILSDSVAWSNLGLLIVDEEQRFGVRQKEKMKRAALSVDVLSLSATPIPRTMYMCMSGLREMSALHTPPIGRVPIVTMVMQREAAAVREAIEAEVARGGQVFYVVPRVEYVDREIAFLRELVPDVRLSYAFGGLKDLEQRIVDFTLRHSDVMVATTIMENGIDIPNVNTIIVQDTQLFGLGQLHQLRGRVGRSNVQAYALLMHPEPSTLQPSTLHRLKVMQREAGLGAGHALAKADLELRGAGNVFGTEQKGSFGAKEVGTEMYFAVLQRAMVYLQQQREAGVSTDQLHLQGDDLMQALGLADDTALLDMSNQIGEQ